MIKFFRHIRQSLMMNNKSGQPASPDHPNGSSERAGRYLKYAIGEIFLVVIGILIALQINNWNEQRKARVEQRNLFNTLIIDFESRLQELKEFDVAQNKGVNAILQLNQIIADPTMRPDDNVLDSILSELVNGYKFNEEFRMLEVIFNTGLINDIKDQKLKRHLIEWPQQVEEMLEEQRMYNDLIDNKLVPFLSDYVSMRSIYEQFDFRQYNLPKGEPVTLTKDYKGLLAHPRFENYLVQSEMLNRVNIIDMNTLILSAEEIIVLLKSKL